MGVRADLNKRVLLAVADAVADDPGYSVTGLDVREGWRDIVLVTCASASEPAELRRLDACDCGGLRSGQARRAYRVVVAEPLCRLSIQQRHSNADRKIGLRVIPTLDAFHHPRLVGTLGDLRLMSLHRCSPAYPWRTPGGRRP